MKYNNIVHGILKNRPNRFIAEVMVEGVDVVLPNVSTHPEFGQALEDAKNAGVEILYLGCKVEEDSLEINREKGS